MTKVLDWMLFSSIPSQEIGCEERLRNDSEMTYCVSSETYKNSSGGEIANVNFFYDDIAHVRT